jgi:phage-related protein
MPKAFGARCHELRVSDGATGLERRLAYRVDSDAIVVAHWWAKKRQRTGAREIGLVRTRLRRYDAAAEEDEEP